MIMHQPGVSKTGHLPSITAFFRQKRLYFGLFQKFQAPITVRGWSHAQRQVRRRIQCLIQKKRLTRRLGVWQNQRRLGFKTEPAFNSFFLPDGQHIKILKHELHPVDALSGVVVAAVPLLIADLPLDTVEPVLRGLIQAHSFTPTRLTKG
jgi:hypothetical protein